MYAWQQCYEKYCSGKDGCVDSIDVDCPYQECEECEYLITTLNGFK